MPLLTVTAQANAGPGERERMLDAAATHFADTGVEASQVIRVDVPGRGAGEEGEGVLRSELDPIVPLLQSGSLFGGQAGLLIVDAQNLQKGEGEMLAAMLESTDLASTTVVIVSAGALARPLAAIAKERGSNTVIGKMWERDVSSWLAGQARARKLRLDTGATAALIQRYGTDTAGLGQALDQLSATSSDKVTEQMVADRFKNRPDEPAWHITDAVGRGDVPTALRRLSDFLVHGHPLVYLATLESDLKRRSLAAAAPDEATFKEWVGGGSERQLAVMWKQRSRVRESSLRRAQEALLRADRVVKTQPEETHRVTLERLTVALCRWYA
jgi:DNA polymerase III delta subunit